MISEKSWDGSASRFTPEQWRSSCILHLGNSLNKNDHKLPIKEPDGSLSRAGVHAAASRFSSVDAPSSAKAAAQASLRSAYKTLGEDAPDNIAAAGETWEGEPMTDMQPEYDGTLQPIPWHGVLAPEGKWSGDKRRFKEDSLSHRPLPLPLMHQSTNDEGHKGSRIAAKIEKVKKADGEMRSSGHLLFNDTADELAGLMAEFGKFGVSVDADSVVFDLEGDPEEGTTFSEARVSAATAVPIPAFAEAWIALGPPPEEWGMDEVPEPETDAALVASGVLSAEMLEQFKRGPGWVTNPEATRRIHSYWTKPGEPGYAKVRWGTPGDFGRCVREIGQEIAEKSPEKLRFIHQQCAQWQHDAIGVWPGKGEKAAAESLELSDTAPAPAVTLVASGAKRAPAAWFQNPNLTQPTALTVTDEGRVYGHIAQWGQCHIGFAGTCVSPPEDDDFGYFMGGQVPLDDGTRANTGTISIGGGHANPRLGLRATVEHYDSTSSACCDVAVGKDQFGIWMAGWVRPGVPDEMVNALMASKVSGDWRTYGGRLTLVAVLAVNVPGFGVPRVQVAAADGEQISLVAAGVVDDEPEKEKPAFDVKALASAVVAEVAAIQERRTKIAELAASVEEEPDAVRV